MNPKRKSMMPEQSLASAYADAPDCPSPDVFLEAAWRALSPADRSRIEEHVEDCPACAAERELARTFDEGAQEAGKRSDDVAYVVSRLERSRQSWDSAHDSIDAVAARRAFARRLPDWRLASAAVLVIGLVTAVLILRSPAPPLPGPTPGEQTIRRGSVITALHPVGELPEFPRLLRWSDSPGTDRYRVRVTGVDEGVLWEGVSREAQAALPGEFVQSLHRAVVYRWRVEALDADGRLVAVSEPAEFRVKPLPASDG